MPIYEYRCTQCSCRFELLRSHNQADDPAPCAECQAPSVRMISCFACGRGDGQPVEGASSGRGRCGSCSGGSCATCR